MQRCFIKIAVLMLITMWGANALATKGDIPVMPVTVRIYPDREIGPVRKELLGLHTAYWHETLYERGVLNPQAERLLADAGIGFLVYPGGNAAYSYIWNDVQLPAEMTTDEFVHLAQRLGATMKITLNPNASLKTAADWVRYVNDDLQAGVVYWEVADEPYLLMNVAEFIAKMKQFVPVIKAVDPSIKIVANISVYNVEYTQRVIREIGHLIDVYSIHILPLPPSQAISKDSKYRREAPEVFFADLLNTNSQVSQQLAQLKTWVRVFHPDKQVEYQIGSFAPVWWGPEHWTTNSLPAGLWIADMLGTFAREQVTAAAYWALLNPYPPGQGDFGMLSPEFKPYAAYHAYSLFANHFGDTMVESGSGHTLLSVYAGLGNEGIDLHVLLVNKSPTTAFDVDFDLGKFTPRGDAAAWILDGPAVADNPYLYGLRKEALRLDIPASYFQWQLPPYAAAVVTIPGMNSETDLSGTPNLALHKVATASSSALHEAPAYYTMSTYLPDRAIDGDPDTRWASRIFGTEDEWFQVDLGQVQPFNRLELHWERWASRYSILVSDDGQTWVEAANQANSSTTGQSPRRIDHVRLPSPVEARYVKVHMLQRPPAAETKRNSTWTPQAYSLWEMGVYYDG